jgi:hypothetical protein
MAPSKLYPSQFHPSLNVFYPKDPESTPFLVPPPPSWSRASVAEQFNKVMDMETIPTVAQLSILSDYQFMDPISAPQVASEKDLFSDLVLHDSLPITTINYCIELGLFPNLGFNAC